MDLCWVHLSLDDVQYGDIAVVVPSVPRSGHHHIFRLEEPPHHIKNSGLTNTGHLEIIESITLAKSPLIKINAHLVGV